MATTTEDNISRKAFSPEIEECLSTVQQKVNMVYTSQYQEFMPFCEQLLSHAVAEQSDYLFAHAYYYLMLYYAVDNNYINTISCALEGIKYQQSIQDYELVARSYNLLAIFTEASGDVAKSIEYALCGIDYCNQYHFDFIHGLIACNLACTFYRNTNFDRALYYYERAEYYLLKDNAANMVNINSTLINLYCCKCYCLLSINKADELEIYTQKILSLLNNNDAQRAPDFLISTYLANYYLYHNDMEKMEYYFSIAKDNFSNTTKYILYQDDIKAYLTLYRKLGRFDELVALLDFYIKKCEDDGAPFQISSYYISERIEYTLLLNDMDTYMLYTQKFLNLFKSEQSKNSDIAVRAEKSHNEYNRIQRLQDEMQLQNQELLVQSQHDTLTSLPNRSYFNRHADEMLAKAHKNQVPFGVEILDIDHFKHINDSYGHMAGDNYLISLAELLHRITEEYEDIFTARYGGDEFVIVYYNKTNEEITEIMKRLKRYAATIKLPDVGVLGLNYLTLSQGCCNTIPKSAGRLWDYMSSADMSLYQIKNSGRNNYSLRNTIKNQ